MGEYKREEKRTKQSIVSMLYAFGFSGFGFECVLPYERRCISVSVRYTWQERPSSEASLYHFFYAWKLTQPSMLNANDRQFFGVFPNLATVNGLRICRRVLFCFCVFICIKYFQSVYFSLFLIRVLGKKKHTFHFHS